MAIIGPRLGQGIAVTVVSNGAVGIKTRLRVDGGIRAEGDRVVAKLITGPGAGDFERSFRAAHTGAIEGDVLLNGRCCSPARS